MLHGTQGWGDGPSLLKQGMLSSSSTCGLKRWPAGPMPRRGVTVQRLATSQQKVYRHYHNPYCGAVQSKTPWAVCASGEMGTNHGLFLDISRRVGSLLVPKAFIDLIPTATLGRGGVMLQIRETFCMQSICI